jgi:heme/copper-type cytochrome/quinol oxidase subunit 2
MILIKILYFVAASAAMAGLGVYLMIPPIRHGDREGLLVRMIIAFMAKLVIGVGFLLLAWKVLGWSSTASAFGMVGAYIIALLVILMTASSAIKHLNAKQQQASEQEGEG